MPLAFHGLCLQPGRVPLAWGAPAALSVGGRGTFLLGAAPSTLHLHKRSAPVRADPSFGLDHIDPYIVLTCPLWAKTSLGQGCLLCAPCLAHNRDSSARGKDRCESVVSPSLSKVPDIQPTHSRIPFGQIPQRWPMILLNPLLSGKELRNIRVSSPSQRNRRPQPLSPHKDQQ